MPTRNKAEVAQLLLDQLQTHGYIESRTCAKDLGVADQSIKVGISTLRDQGWMIRLDVRPNGDCLYHLLSSWPEIRKPIKEEKLARLAVYFADNKLDPAHIEEIWSICHSARDSFVDGKLWTEKRLKKRERIGKGIEKLGYTIHAFGWDILGGEVTLDVTAPNGKPKTIRKCI